MPSHLTDGGCPPILFSDAIPSPCFVLDEERLARNAHILEKAGEKSGAKILLALKGFAAWAVFPMLSRAFHGPLWGTCASSVDEARLGREKFGGETHAYAPAWTKTEIIELLDLCDHIVFNSLAQWRTFRPLVEKANATFRRDNPVQCGLRLNHEHSEGAVAIYNPCSPGSRLGIRQQQLDKAQTGDLDGITGLHFHSLCEQGADALARTLEAYEQKFSPYLSSCKWLNFGGGHHITKPGYDVDLLCQCVGDWHKRYGATIYLEPGEAVALDAGWLVATILDIVEADMPVAILDVSAACHMPDVLEMPYRPEVWYRRNHASLKAGEAGSAPYTVRLGGKSCLAGDVIGEYSFQSMPVTGQKLVFSDMAIYSMVKTTTFNGLRLPSIGILESSEKGGQSFRLLREFGYDDFKNRLS